jgi:hypothetical protein
LTIEEVTLEGYLISICIGKKKFISCRLFINQ